MSKTIRMELQVDPEARALIFDLDGTLSDSLPVHLAVWRRLGDAYGFVFDEKLVYDMTGMPTIYFARKVVEENHLQMAPVELVRLKQQAFLESGHLIRPIVPVIRLARQSHGRLPMSVGTGANRRSARMQLERLGIAGLFDHVVTSDDVRLHKPEPETFLTCARLMGVAPPACQVFEDGELGLTAARTAGMIVTDVRPFRGNGNGVAG